MFYINKNDSIFEGKVYSLLNSSLQYHPKFDNRWKEVARMNQKRKYKTCLNGKSYAVIGIEWSSMSEKINSRSSHSLAALKSKLFVIGRTTNNCEV